MSSFPKSPVTRPRSLRSASQRRGRPWLLLWLLLIPAGACGGSSTVAPENQTTISSTVRPEENQTTISSMVRPEDRQTAAGAGSWAWPWTWGMAPRPLKSPEDYLDDYLAKESVDKPGDEPGTSEPEPDPNEFDDIAEVQLLLYTRNNSDQPEHVPIYDTCDPPAALDSFDPARSTRFVIHGWNSDPSYMQGILNAYLSAPCEYNVVLVDWSAYVGDAYTAAVKAVPRLGQLLAAVIRELQRCRGLRLADLTLVGHSLGAHAAGVAGRALGGCVGRIVGLDPAAPFFWGRPQEERLDPTDAQLVQVIHTSTKFLGLRPQLGHADFYPNGGSSQPGCEAGPVGCSHSRAKQYFAESVLSRRFVGTSCGSYGDYEAGLCRCNSTAVMGECMPANASGAFFLDTNSDAPYARGCDN